MNIGKYIDSRDTCALAKCLNECNRILVNPVVGSYDKKRAWEMKMYILRQTTPYIDLEEGGR